MPAVVAENENGNSQALRQIGRTRQKFVPTDTWKEARRLGCSGYWHKEIASSGEKFVFNPSLILSARAIDAIDEIIETTKTNVAKNVLSNKANGNWIVLSEIASGELLRSFELLQLCHQFAAMVNADKIQVVLCNDRAQKSSTSSLISVLIVMSAVDHRATKLPVRQYILNVHLNELNTEKHAQLISKGIALGYDEFDLPAAGFQWAFKKMISSLRIVAESLQRLSATNFRSLGYEMTFNSGAMPKRSHASTSRRRAVETSPLDDFADATQARIEELLLEREQQKCKERAVIVAANGDDDALFQKRPKKKAKHSKISSDMLF